MRPNRFQIVILAALALNIIWVGWLTFEMRAARVQREALAIHLSEFGYGIEKRLLPGFADEFADLNFMLWRIARQVGFPDEDAMHELLIRQQCYLRDRKRWMEDASGSPHWSSLLSKPRTE